MGPCGHIDNEGFTLYGETAFYPYARSYQEDIRQLGAGGAGSKQNSRIEARQIIDLKRLLPAEEVRKILEKAHADIRGRDLEQKLGNYL